MEIFLYHKVKKSSYSYSDWAYFMARVESVKDEKENTE